MPNSAKMVVRMIKPHWDKVGILDAFTGATGATTLKRRLLAPITLLAPGINAPVPLDVDCIALIIASRTVVPARVDTFQVADVNVAKFGLVEAPPIISRAVPARATDVLKLGTSAVEYIPTKIA